MGNDQITTAHSPRIILGTMTFGSDSKDGARITSLEEYQQCLDILSSRGHHELDTARAYCEGQQEAFTRRAGWRDRGYKVASKLYQFSAGDHSAHHIEQAVVTFLGELGTDCLDSFYLHAADRAIPFVERLKKLDQLYRKGKIANIGLSNFSAAEASIQLTKL